MDTGTGEFTSHPRVSELAFGVRVRVSELALGVRARVKCWRRCL